MPDQFKFACYGLEAESDLATQVADTLHSTEGATPLSLEDISETVDCDTAATLETVPAAAEPSSSSKTSDSLVSLTIPTLILMVTLKRSL